MSLLPPSDEWIRNESVEEDEWIFFDTSDEDVDESVVPPEVAAVHVEEPPATPARDPGRTDVELGDGTPGYSGGGVVPVV
jgi:hypothetical protein